VTGRDTGPVQWEIDSECTLTLHHGTTPDVRDFGQTSSRPWISRNANASIAKVRFDGDITIYNSKRVNEISDIHEIGVLGNLPNIQTVQVDGTVHLVGSAATRLFYGFSALASFTGRGLEGLDLSQNTCMFGMFSGCSGLTSLDMPATWDTSNVITMSRMFSGCSGLTSLDMPATWDTSNVITMSRMFSGCSGLTSLALPDNWNTSKLSDMSYMFSGLELTSQVLTLPAGWNTSSVRSMTGMFARGKLTTVVLPSTWNMNVIYSMDSMFEDCAKLTSVTFPDTWNLSTVWTTMCMFRGCSSLSSVHLPRALRFRNLNDAAWMFKNCSKLTSLTIPGDDVDYNIMRTTGMFQGCTSLVSLDLRGLSTSGIDRLDGNNYMSKDMDNMLPDGLQELWLGPHTILYRGPRSRLDSEGRRVDIPATSACSSALNSKPWVRIPDTGPSVPISSISSAGPGHYRIISFNLIIDYNNGETNHTETVSLDNSRYGSRRITWGTHPAPAGKVFEGWTLTTRDPAHVTLSGSTISWSARADDPDAKVTATWRSLTQPSLDAPIVHALTSPESADVTVSTPADAKPGDTISLTTPRGYTQTYTLRTNENGAVSHTFTGIQITQLRDPTDFDAHYQLTARISAVDRRDTVTTVYGTPAEREGILPYTTVNYQPGTGTGTPPASMKALTDTAGQNAQITVAGPDPITRPEHNLFDTWQANHGTIRPGTTPVTTAMGTTDTDGRTTIDLTAQWTPLPAPGIGTTARNPADNTITVTGTAKPRDPADTIRLCHPYSGGGTACQYATPESTDSHGNRLPYDGTTEHPWKTTLPAYSATDMTVDATLVSKDRAYPATSDPVRSAPARGTIRIPAPYTSTLPLTGENNRPTLLALAAALATLMLLTTAANTLRNRRHKARHRTAATAKTDGQ
jgi:surface protein